MQSAFRAPALGSAAAAASLGGERAQGAVEAVALLTAAAEEGDASPGLVHQSGRSAAGCSLRPVAALATLLLASVALAAAWAGRPGGARGAARTPTSLADTVGLQGTGYLAAPSTPQPPVAPAAAPGPRRGSFLVLGDWGFDHDFHGNLQSSGCQRAVAAKMLEKMQELGDVRFVINLGDSFYPGGVQDKSDWQWDTKWRDIYDPKLRSVPWYSVYGNHDYYFDACACSNDPRNCAQVNGDASNLNFFYMPNLTWFKSHPELDLEVIAMDMNEFSGFNWAAPGAPMWCLGYPTLLHGQRPCHHHCWGSLAARAQASLQLFQERLALSQARNLVVFSHYPTDYFGSLPNFLTGLKSEWRRVEYFGGHRHNVDDGSTISTAPNHNWLSGGGGGWSSDGAGQGFIVGEIGQDYTLQTYPVIVDAVECRP